jgi:hypothetical protein
MRKGIKKILEKLDFFKNYLHFLLKNVVDFGGFWWIQRQIISLTADDI